MRARFSYLSELFSLSDEQAMLRVQKENDPRAFALLVRRWQGRIQRLCARLTGDVHRGEDLAQEVFMRIFAHRNDYRGQASFATYLRRIALNACYDEQRRLNRRSKNSLSRNNEAENTCDAALTDSMPPPDIVVAGRERAELVRKALFRLSESYRQVVILRHYEGLRFREIAEVLDVPQGTVQSRMAEALTQLGLFLKPILNEETINSKNEQGMSKLNRKGVL
jgi:RNA polymerase sigma-70 factor (ECF subfamily)